MTRFAVFLFLLLTSPIQSKVHAEESTKEPATKPRLIVGCDPNYTLTMERGGKTWSRGDKPEDLCTILKSSGMEMIRVRLWTKDDGANGLHESTTLMKRAKDAGLRLYVAMFLCDDWADYIKQPAPAAWKDLTFDEKLKKVEAYAELVARHFVEQKLPVEYWEIGNEIDFGICGVFEEEWPKRVSPEYMSAVIWPKEAAIIRAAQTGIKRVQPDAKFTLHLTQWWQPEYNAAFFKSMQANQAQVDLAGLSFFPTSNLTKDAASARIFRQGQSALRVDEETDHALRVRVPQRTQVCRPVRRVESLGRGLHARRRRPGPLDRRFSRRGTPRELPAQRVLLEPRMVRLADVAGVCAV